MHAQKAVLSGTVTDDEGMPLIGAHIGIPLLERTEASDENGFFKFTDLPHGILSLEVSHVGFETIHRTFEISKDNPNVEVLIILRPGQNQLNEVVVQGESKATQIKKSPLSVSLVETEAYHHRSVSTSDLLGTVPGVRVRQSGGVGNSAEVSLQGLTGRQVRFFIDGIPMDYLLPTQELGLGPSLAMLPTSQIERIEVYKGAVPVSLATDALGGAVNLVPKKANGDYLETSAQYGSFGTWNVALNAGKQLMKNLDLGFSGYYNASDNDYTVDDVNLVDENGNPQAISTRKFHDAFKSYLFRGSLSASDIPWADRVSLSASIAGLYDEIQHNFEMRQPYGEALNKVRTFNTALEYDKKEIIRNVDAKAYIGYNRIVTQFIDTTLNIYNWRGEIVGRRNSGGEITTSRNDLELTGNNGTGRLQFTYAPNGNTEWTLNGVGSLYKRVGEDPVAEAFYGEDHFARPIRIGKLNIGIGLEKELFDKNLTSLTGIKWYHYHAKGFEIVEGEAVSTRQQNNEFGAMQSFSWKPSTDFTGKLSYEYATRLPDRVETLGDFSVAVAANPDLRPERSHNINLGIQYKRTKWTAEVNGFFREVKDIIILQAVPPPVLSTYENLLKARIMGVEGEVKIYPIKKVSLTLNATYQDLRNRSDKEDAGVSSNRYFGARLPNRPYLFGNGELQFTQTGLLGDTDLLQIWWTAQYVHEFFRYWEIDGRREDKLTIPEQWVQHAGVSYTDKSRKYTLTLEAHNLLDKRVFDNFGVQKPGRSWHVKLKAILF